MRAFLIAFVLAFPFASPAVAFASSKTATIIGTFHVAGASCRGVKLIPRTAESEREIFAMFGTTEPAARAIPLASLKQVKADQAPSLGREVGCRNWGRDFRFKDVAPGDYFVTALASNFSELSGVDYLDREAVGGRAPEKRNIYLMRPVSVSAADRTVRLTLKQD